jgi:hypothetical protein
VSINGFIEAIAANGGMSMSNGYEVEFDLSSTGELQGLVSKVAGNIATDSEGNKGFLVKYLCDEAQLPSVQAMTGQINGRHLGEGQINYAHTKMYSDFSLSWMCDANMTPLKFLTMWHSYIFNGGNADVPVADLAGNRFDSFKGSANSRTDRPFNRSIRLKFPNQYMAKVKICKTERGKNAPNSRSSVIYLMEDCYPYAVDAVPLSYGASQITKVTANFYYAKHTVFFNDISKFGG